MARRAHRRRPATSEAFTPGASAPPASARDQSCPECGAPRVEGLDCWSQLGMLLGWEQHDPALQAVHFLTVASYNLQHPAAFTEEALAALAESLRQHLDEGLPVAAIRRAMAVEFAGRTRVTRNQADRQSVLRRWTITIADVYLPDRPAGAAERVHAWAASILRELASSDG